MGRVISYSEKTGYNDGDYLLMDNGEGGTKRIRADRVGVQLDSSLTQPGMAADAASVGIFKEYTRNLNVSLMGQYGSASDGKIYDRNSQYYGMKAFISVEPNTTYTISNGGISNSDRVLVILQINTDNTFSRQSFNNANTRSITTGSNVNKLHVHVYSASSLTLNNPYIQIEKGSFETEHINPISAIDGILREEIKYPTYVFRDAVGAMVDVAKTYFDIAYGDNSNLVYNSAHGLFVLQTTSDNTGEENLPAIVCSQLAWALMKGITWKNSRYVKDINHTAQWGFTADGKEQTTQDGEAYDISYYNHNYEGVEINEDDYPSYDYMIASQTYRYALNHGWAYDIDVIRPKVRAGDFVFSTSEDSRTYKQISHIALVLFVGQDNGRVTLLESNTFSYKTKNNVGVGIRYAPISELAYGARFPVDAAPYKVSLVEKHGSFSGVSSSYTIEALFRKNHEHGFYTVILEGEISPTSVPQIGVLYSGDTSRTYYRMMIQGGKIICFFYAPSEFTSITIAADTGASYDITDCNLYKGYMPC